MIIESWYMRDTSDGKLRRDQLRFGARHNGCRHGGWVRIGNLQLAKRI